MSAKPCAKCGLPFITPLPHALHLCPPCGRDTVPPYEPGAVNDSYNPRKKAAAQRRSYAEWNASKVDRPPRYQDAQVAYFEKGDIE